MDEKIIVKMNDAIKHRGPDSYGYLHDYNFSMGMRRLAIIDLTTGDQPIYNLDRTLAIVFNGEVYNFREIRDKLHEKGVAFKTQSDTEVILKGYEYFGTDIFSMLNGMFGIAIYNFQSREVIIARDRLGIKPLYYYQDNKNFIFASEIKSILVHPAYKKEVDFTSLKNILKYKYIVGDGSMFKGITKVKQGSYMAINSTYQIGDYQQFWKAEDHIDNEKLSSFADSKKLIRDSIRKSVARRLISDVPLGVFLSGGIDSAILTNVATEVKGDKVSTFSIGFDSKSYNELPLARLSAKFNNTNHHELIIRPKNLIGSINELVGYLDEPLGDYAIIPNYYVSKFARENVKVALSGAGADEFFGGYERYWLNKGAAVFSSMPDFLIQSLIHSANLLPNSSSKKSFKRRFVKYITNAKNSLGFRYDSSFHLLLDNERENLLTDKALMEENDQHEIDLLNWFDQFPDLTFLTKASYTDLKSILPNAYLMKEDRMSMATSLEVRVPFLDHELVENSYKIKDSYKIKGLKTKYLLKEIYKDRIHKDILNRPKQGFEVPIRVWLREELRKDVSQLFEDSKLVSERIIDKRTLEWFQKEHYQGNRDNSKLIFTMICLELWYRQHF